MNKIFEKRLLALLTYHILRYEHFLKSNSVNPKKLDKFLDDYQKICQNLLQIQETEGKVQLSVNLVDLINQIADYVIPKENPVRERSSAVMGGKILQLASERLLEKGRSLGITEGRVRELCSMVQDRDITLECAAKRLKITVPELKKQMLENGYGFQEI